MLLCVLFFFALHCVKKKIILFNYTIEEFVKLSYNILCAKYTTGHLNALETAQFALKKNDVLFKCTLFNLSVLLFLNKLYAYHINEEVRERITNVIGLFENLLTIVKTKKPRLYVQVT